MNEQEKEMVAKNIKEASTEVLLNELFKTGQRDAKVEPFSKESFIEKDMRKMIQEELKLRIK